jgi:hypothetical protein
VLDDGRLLRLDPEPRFEFVDRFEREPAALEPALPDFVREPPDRDFVLARAMWFPFPDRFSDGPASALRTPGRQPVEQNLQG